MAQNAQNTKSGIVNELVKATLNSVAKAYAAESTRKDFEKTEPVVYPMAFEILDGLARAEAKLLNLDDAEEQISYRREVFMERMNELRAQWLARWGDKY